MTNTPLIHSVSCFNLETWSFVWGSKPTKAPGLSRLWTKVE